MKSMQGVCIGSNEGNMQAGRIYVTPSDLNSLQEGLPEKLGWEDEKVITLNKVHEDFLKFFSGEIQDKIYLDDPTAFRLDRHLERFPQSAALNKFVGSYTYYYTSVKNREIGRFIVKITENGQVEMKGTDIHRWEGRALYYPPHLIIRFFETTHSKKFVGVCIFYDSSPKISSMIGISTLSRSPKPIGRKVVIVKSSKSYEDLHPNRIEVASKEFHELDEVIPGLAKSLIGGYNNFIQVSKKDNFSSLKRVNTLAKSFFYSACYLAKENMNDEALQELRKAIFQGFSKQELFEGAINNGALKGIRKKIIKLLKTIPNCLISLN